MSDARILVSCILRAGTFDQPASCPDCVKTPISLRKSSESESPVRVFLGFHTTCAVGGYERERTAISYDWHSPVARWRLVAGK